MRKWMCALCLAILMAVFAAAAVHAQEVSPVDDLIAQGWTVTDSDTGHGKQVYLLESRSGITRLRIASWNGVENAYACVDNDTIPRGAWLDDVHAGEDEIFVHWHADDAQKDATAEQSTDAERSVTLARKSDGTWYLKGGIQNTDPEHAYVFVANGIKDLLAAGNGCNDGVTYGSHPFMNVKSLDFSKLPMEAETAFAFLDQRSWAVVCNPNPEDRLNLREAPRRNARSIGKFDNRTPVRVLAKRDGWCQVQVGGNGISGWMMEKYLAFGEAMKGVECEFDSEHGLSFRSENGEDVYELPKLRSRSWRLNRVDYVIGMNGDDWFILMDEEGRTFYVPSGKLWGGNN